MSDRAVPHWLRQARSGWTWTGETRPPWADETAEGQESVWDYPRPPRLAPDTRHIVVRDGNHVVAETRRAVRVLETASPPTVYIPRDDIDDAMIRPEAGSSLCEWKGPATYWTVVLPDGTRHEQVGWSYERPFPEFESIQGHLSFYPARLECTIDGERVEPQPGGFYGGWITPEVIGPFKGAAGSTGW